MVWRLRRPSSITLLSQIRGRLVRQHTLDLAHAGDRGRDAAARLTREALLRDRLDELTDPEPARVARRPARGQDVVRPDGLVGVRHRGFLAEEQRAVVAQAPAIPVDVPRLPLEMLGRVLIRDRGRLLVIADHDDFAIAVPRLAHDLARAE